MKPPIHLDSTLPLISVHGQANYNPMDSSIQMVKQPIYKYYARNREEQAGGFGTQSTASTLLKHFKQQEMEMYYSEKQLRPEIEEEIKSGFFEITKKFNESVSGSLAAATRDPSDTQVYVSHLCLHNYHPIFSKFALETVKIILHYSSIVYLNRGQTLYAEKFNDQYIYIVLFGRLRLFRPQGLPNAGLNQKNGAG